MAKITWYGHSALKLEIAGKILFVDPMFDQNPSSPIKSTEITKADAVYVTHDHPDHLGESFDICKRTKAVFVAVIELAEQAAQEGVENVARLNVGGSWSIGDVKLNVVQAIHSAAKGTPTGVVIQGEKLSIYHSGDTSFFTDMRVIGEHYCLDLACLPIGGNFTMDADQASEAVTILKPRFVLPMHYGTFPVLAKSAEEFIKKVHSRYHYAKVLSPKPGESFDLNPKEVEISTQS